MHRLALVLASLVLAAPCARAGGASFTDEDTSAGQGGPTFYGFVKSAAGDAVDDVKITVSVKSLNASIILHTDSQGHFMFNGFDKNVKPDDVAVDCSKDGYKEVAHAKKPALYPNAPIEVDCILAKQ